MRRGRGMHTSMDTDSWARVNSLDRGRPPGVKVQSHDGTKEKNCIASLAWRMPGHFLRKNTSNKFDFCCYCYHRPVPAGSPSRGGDVTVYIWHKPTERAHPFLFYSCVYFCLYGPFNCISFHKLSRKLSVFSLCSSDFISALLVLSTIYLFVKVSFSPDINPSGWLGSKHQLTN